MIVCVFFLFTQTKTPGTALRGLDAAQLGDAVQHAVARPEPHQRPGSRRRIDLFAVQQPGQ